MATYRFSNEKFLNPYQFVPVSDPVKRTTDAEQIPNQSLHTGYLECRLTTKTPLVIPDTTCAKTSADGHNTYPAYRVGEQVVIPGSNIRGMLRSVYETATNSCMVTMEPEQHITVRAGAYAPFSPGVLKRERDAEGKKDVWRLYPADRLSLRTKDWKIGGESVRYLQLTDHTKLYYGDEVSVRTNGDHCSQISKGENTGCYLFLGEAFSKKYCESVFKIESKPVEQCASAIRTAMKGLEDTLALYRSESVNRNLKANSPKTKHFGYPGYENAKENGAIPIWYQKKNGKLYLSMAAIGRYAYQNNMEQISNNHSPCVSRKQLCPACSVFGMVGKDNGKSLGSKIRVTDAVTVGNVMTTKGITLQELGSPHPSYFLFYSTDGKEYDEEDASIRGRKYYWHNPMVNSDPSIYSTKEKNIRNGTFELINTGNQFAFRVYFDSLTEEQLAMLKWAIALPDSQKTLLHKLGHGKPLGLGSVKLEIREAVERSYGEGYTVSQTAILPHQPALLHQKSWEQLSLVLEYRENSKTKIRYPYVKLSDEAKKAVGSSTLTENVMASHKWFGENSKKGNRKLLPDGKVYLPALEILQLDLQKNIQGEKRKDSSPQQKKDSYRSVNQEKRTENRPVQEKSNSKKVHRETGKIVKKFEQKAIAVLGNKKVNIYPDGCLFFSSLKVDDLISGEVVEKSNGMLKAKNIEKLS